jgi:BASS family bile acid:Na+ symporter
MIEYLQRIADLSVSVFVVSSMLTMGMSQPLAEVIAPLRKPLPVALALLVNFLASPLIAVILIRLVPLQPAHAIGLLLLAAAAGAPFLPKLAEIAHGNLAYSVALMVLLVGGSIVFMPLALPYMVPGLTASPWEIAKPLLSLMLVPLGIGFGLALSGASWVEGLLSVSRKVSNIALLLLVVLMVGLNLKTLVATLGSFAIGTYLIYLLALLGMAYALGAADRPNRGVFALGAASRNIPAALVVAGSSLNDPAVTVMLVVAFIVTLVLLLALAKGFPRRGAEELSHR